MTHRRPLAALCICVSFLLGCPGATDPGGGSGLPDGSSEGGDAGTGINGTGLFLDESERLAIIDAARQAQASAGKSRAEQDAALIAFLSAHPKIEATGLSSVGSNVWARFIDGTLYLDFSGRSDDAVSVRAHSQAELAQSELPGKVGAITAFNLQPWIFTDSSDRIGGWLAAQAYDVKQRKAELSYSDFQTMTDIGVLFWQTHGAFGELRPLKLDAAGKPMLKPDGGPAHLEAFGYMIREVGTPTPSAELKSLRDRNLLVAATVSSRDGGGQTHYAITE
jgi:hypothetical protein